MVNPCFKIQYVNAIKVLARTQRKEGDNVKSMTTSKELRHGKKGGPPPIVPLAKTLAIIEGELTQM